MLFKQHDNSSPLNSTHYAMLYPQNGDRIVAVHFVTSFHPMCTSAAQRTCEHHIESLGLSRSSAARNNAQRVFGNGPLHNRRLPDRVPRLTDCKLLLLEFITRYTDFHCYILSHCYCATDRSAGYCDDRVCVSVCLSASIMSITLHRATSLRRRAQPNAPASSYWLRRVQDDGGRRDWTSSSWRGWLGRSLRCSAARDVTERRA